MKKYLIIKLTLVGIILLWLGNWLGTFYSQVQSTTVKATVQAMLQNLGFWLNSKALDLSWSKPALIGMGIGLLFLALFAFASDTTAYFNGREHGDARWGTRRELRRFRDSKDWFNNTILGFKALMRYDAGKNRENERNNNVYVVGGSGSGKTRGYVIPNLLQADGRTSFFVTDPKGTTVRQVGKFLQAQHYTVKVVDFDTLKNTWRVNPFAYVEDEEDLRLVITTLIDSTNGEHAAHNEPFWDKSEELLLNAVFGYLFYIYKGCQNVKGTGVLPTLADIPKLIRLVERKNETTPSILELMFEDFSSETKFGSNNYAAMQFQSFKNYKGQTRASVMAIVTARFSMFDLDYVRDFIGKDELEIDSWIEKPTAVFLKIPDLGGAYTFLVPMITLLAFRRLEKRVDQVYQGTPPLRLRMIFDEFTNLGNIPLIEEAVSVLRSRDISCEFLSQTFNQLVVRHEKTWKTILANCDSVIYLAGGTETDTVTWFSDYGGKQTVYRRVREKEVWRRESFEQPLISTNQVAQLKRSMMLLRIASMPLFKLKKFNLEKHPNAKYLGRKPTDENWFYWKHYNTPKAQFLAEIKKEEQKTKKVIAKQVLNFSEI